MGQDRQGGYEQRWSPAEFFIFLPYLSFITVGPAAYKAIPVVPGAPIKGSKHLEARDPTLRIILKLIEGHSNADRTEMTFYNHKTIYSCSAGGMAAATLEVQGATKPTRSFLVDVVPKDHHNSRVFTESRTCSADSFSTGSPLHSRLSGRGMSVWDFQA